MVGHRRAHESFSPKNSAVVIIVEVITVLVLAVVARIYVYGPAKGLFCRTFWTPSILRASFVENLDQQQARIQRERLLSIYQSHTGSYGLRKTVGSVEGNPIGYCLVVENGRLIIVTDYTRDSFGSRDFALSYPTNIILGPVQAAEGSVPFTPAPGQIVLKCYLAKGTLYF